MAKRKAIPKSVRFEVFKRDSFKCQYCGASAPEVVLNVDHIDPVDNGGGNDIINLITSCFACNSGKSNKLLTDNSAVSKQKQQLDELNERRQQLEMLMEWRLALSDKSYEMDKVMDYFNQQSSTAGISLTPVGENKLRALLKKYGLDNVLEAIDIICEKFYFLPPSERWEKLEKTLKYKDEPEHVQHKAYILGIVKNKWGAYRIENASYWLDEAIALNIDTEHLIQSTKSINSYNRWLDMVYDYVQKHKA